MINIINAGAGVHKLGTRPHISNTGVDVQGVYSANIYTWFRELSERLRYVKVVCGDWTRVCGGNWQDNMGIVGMFFDPPYGVEDRDKSVYHHDSTTVAADVMTWVRERGEIKKYRIVLAGYEEYQSLLSEGWTSHKWKAGSGYSSLGNNPQGKSNRMRETLYFSPHCLTQRLF